MAESIHVLGEGGAVFKMDLPLPEAIADRLVKGHLRQVNPDGSPIEESERPTGVPGTPDKRPNVNAPKADWVGWAVHEGASAEEADAATKQDLIEKYGTAPVEKTPEELAAEEAAKTAAEEQEAAEKVAADEAAALAEKDAADAAALAAGTPTA